jgi:transcription elongation factor Elf1
MLYSFMGWWIGEEEKREESSLPYTKCSECGDYKEVSKKYLNKMTEEMVTICYDCGKQRYIESLMVVSAIDGFDDL